MPGWGRRRGPKWLKGVEPGASVAAEVVPEALRARLTAALSEKTGRADVALHRVWAFAPGTRRAPPVMLIEGRDGPAGLLAVARPGKSTVDLGEPIVVRHLDKHEISTRAPLTLDADRRPDLVVPWRYAHRGLTRFGVWIARTDPPGLSSVELGTIFRDTVTEVPTACFAPLLGTRARLMVLHRKLAGQQELELRLPAPDGAWQPARGLYAGVLGQGMDHEAAEARWRASFPPPRRRRGRRATPSASSQQAELGPCPREGLVLPSPLLSTADGWSVVGPLGLATEPVRARLRKLKGAPRAALIIGLGQAE